MEADLIKLLAEGGPLAVAVALMFYWIRRTADKEREDKLLLISTLQHNTEVLSELTTLVKRMNGKEER